MIKWTVQMLHSVFFLLLLHFFFSPKVLGRFRILLFFRFALLAWKKIISVHFPNASLKLILYPL